MKCLSVSNFCAALLCGLALQAGAATISRTQFGQYDLASGSRQLYTLNLTATEGGANMNITQPDRAQPLFTSGISVCAFAPKTPGTGGYLHLQTQNKPAADSPFNAFMGYVSDNNLHVFIKPLSDSRQIVLIQDTLSLIVVDRAMMSITDAGCTP
ncbi:hypothetical protein [Enterobacter sp.]|uniref:hypothetical protein n=1 Tax=Enterobacter sp. TaxID=42895 RepID=UPI00296FB0E8|nr:hypothetical protein [Enterobacter sp.]